jgi:hypothetical protein
MQEGVAPEIPPGAPPGSVAVPVHSVFPWTSYKNREVPQMMLQHVDTDVLSPIRQVLRKVDQPRGRALGEVLICVERYIKLKA